jgi:Tol biopolymer transport system component
MVTMRKPIALLASTALTASLLTLGTIVGVESAYAAYPGTNGKIAFSSFRNDQLDVYTMNPDGSAQVNLTPNVDADDDGGPAWSPDGSRIAFTSGRTSGNEEVYVMNADGSGQTDLTNNAAFDVSPTWSPDGSKIAFTTIRGTTVSQIYVMNADGSGQTNVSNSAVEDEEPAWSPDGSKIAFTSVNNSTAQIWVMNADGSGRVNISNDPVGARNAAWSPDGTKIAFMSFRNGNSDIYVMNADGSGQTQLTTDPNLDDAPAWSPDGTKIAFNSTRQGNNQVFVMNADGSGATNVTNEVQLGPDNTDLAPDWQPIPPPDTTPPTAAPTAAPPANGAGWNNTDVTVNWNWTDVTPGIDTANCTTSSTSSGEGADMTLTAHCTDLAGNIGTSTHQVSVDKTPPTLTCNPAAFTVGSSSATVSASVTDGLSGPVASTVSVSISAADLATAGVKSVNLTGEDNAGNTTPVSCSYTVAYLSLGFLEPIPQSSYKRGSSLPVKFRLGDANGVPISDAAAQALLTPTCHVQITLDAHAQGCASYDATADVFFFVLRINKSLSAGSHVVGVRVTAPDGSGLLSEQSVTVLIRK